MEKYKLLTLFGINLTLIRKFNSRWKSESNSPLKESILMFFTRFRLNIRKIVHK